MPRNTVTTGDNRRNGGASGRDDPPDIICFSHLRWDFVYQRPQHLLGRFAKDRRVLFVEEPVWHPGTPRLEIGARAEGVQVVVPHLSEGMLGDAAEAAQRALVADLMAQHSIVNFILWYYTPMALGFSRHLAPRAVIYDCMDELSLFRGAPAQLIEWEEELLRRADLVFTGGRSLYEAKRDRHPAVSLFASSIDADHFRQARRGLPEPADQHSIPHPRLGFFGVIDERMDLELLAGIAQARPQWQLVMIGPVVKVDEAELPRHPSIHYLGSRSYDELPAYIAGWDVALLPFALNDSTRFISPTKTPEYLAAGRPVVSTGIRDVVHPYGAQRLVRIADGAGDFIEAVEAALAQGTGDAEWLRRVDAFLAETSWDRTQAQMAARIDAVIHPTAGKTGEREATQPFQTAVRTGAAVAG